MDILRFYLNGTLREIDFSKKDSPSLSCSVLHYLRGYEKMTGTKEVCGRGDCGACTVIVAHKDPVSGKESRISVDSCLMPLPRLHGKHLLTIEAPGEILDTEPVRDAFLEQRASQCGVCSPGMVLSTYIHLKNGLPLNREEIQRSLSGNLCRCTGYQAIVDAALSLDKNPRARGTSEKPLDFLPADDHMITFRKDGVVYVRPRNMEEFHRVRKAYPRAVVASGFTGSAMNCAGSVIDVSSVREMLEVRHTPSCISIGASCNFETVKKELGGIFPYMNPYLDAFGSLQVRNQASVGGNIAEGSPVGDTMPLCLVHDAVCIVSGPRRVRRVEAARFTTGYRETALKPSEILMAVEFPLPDRKTLYFAHKQSRRRNMDISSVSFAAAVTLEGKKCTAIRLAYGGMAATPARAMQTERFLKGKVFSEGNCRKATAFLEKDFTPLSDIRGSAAYRMDVAKNMLVFLYESYNGNHD